MFWGKYDPRTGNVLPLLAHAIDVAVVFRALCEIDGIRRALAKSTSTRLHPGMLERLAVLAMLHDLGKANLGFQDKIKQERNTHAGHIRELEPLFFEANLQERFLASLPPELVYWFADGPSADSYFFAIFSHHGRPVTFSGSKAGNYRIARDVWWQPDGWRDPFAAVKEISDFAPIAFPQAFSNHTPHLPPEPEFHHRFAGLVMLADWIGSHSHWFPIVDMTPTERLQHSRQMAPRALEAIGLDSAELKPVLKSVGANFQSRFSLRPLPLQQLTDRLDPDDPKTRLIVLESETGSGKTEAALNWFARLFSAGKVDSLYFALPTRVAAREMYGRVNSWVERWFSDHEQRPVTLLAVPGYVQIDGQPAQRVLPEQHEANIWEDDEQVRRLERQWAAAGPKRFLAASVAVGTIDQALLSVVQTNHAHLRSVCLDRSLLVVDEVHASDVYMSHLLRFLLEHHLSVGGYAMLLSATLGSAAHHNYITILNPQATSPSFPEAIFRPYPSLTLADGSLVTSAEQSLRPKRVQISLVPHAFDPEEIIEPVLVPALQAGARVLVVLNTVPRAIRLLKAIETHPAVSSDWLFSCGGLVCPHHGRFAPEDREILDRAISARFGKGSPPGPVLLVGTQTLEQSLDIDADLLITDLAPSDVLLQRIGRLHRHQRSRPPGYESAKCVVLVPDRSLEEGLTAKGEVRGDWQRLGFGSVYEDLRMLELTRRVLEEKGEIRIPRDNRELVEFATHPDKLESFSGRCWLEHGLKVSGVELAKRVNAHTVLQPFHETFRDLTYVDIGRAVATRLGSDAFRLALAEQLTSPFGASLTSVLIPEHLMPNEYSGEGSVQVLAAGEVSLLQLAGKVYSYSRYGLEVVD